MDITVWEPGRVMMGWADPRNVARREGTPLFARALAIHDPASDERFVFVSVELAIVTDVLRDAIVARVATRSGLPSRSLMLTATHNHSGPGGFAGYLWYDIPSGGFSQRVFDTLVDRIAEAIEQALAATEPASLRFVRADTRLREVATNRAWRAYNRNPEVAKVTKQTAEDAVDPEMQLLRVDALDGRPLGLVSWFGLHGTCFHGDSHVVQADHKGVAADLFESQQAEGFVAIFAQGSCGDVTSNRRMDARRGVTVGPGKDDAESCALVARAEVEAARTLFDLAATLEPTPPTIATTIQRMRLAERDVAPEHVEGARGLRTSLPIIALGMALGTDEGPGPLHPLRLAQRGISTLTRLRFQARKRLGREPRGSVHVPLVVFASNLHARVLGVIPAELRILPTGILPELGATLRRIREGDANGTRWMPSEVDVQIARIGPFAIVGVAAEPTTTAGARIRRSVERALAPIGVEDVVVCGYANGYSGYLVTPEEHLEQGYESGATIFGRWTLPAWQTVLDEVAGTLTAR